MLLDAQIAKLQPKDEQYERDLRKIDAEIAELERTKEGAKKKVKKRIRKKEPTGYQVGRPKKGEVRVKNPTTRIERQVTQDLETMLADLPVNFACGSKRGSKGHLLQWFGYKLHLDVDDLGIPLSCIVTSASLIHGFIHAWFVPYA